MPDYTSLDILDSGDALNGSVRVQMKDLLTSALKIILTGSNTAGSQVQPSDLGTLRLFRGGDQKWGLDMARLFDFQKEWYKTTPEETSVDDGEIRLVTYLENRLPALLEATNGFDWSPEDVVVLDFNSDPGGGATLNTKAESLSYEVRPMLSPSVYEGRSFNWHSQAVIRSAAGKEEVEGITESNVALIYLHDPDDVITEVSLRRQMPGGDEVKYRDDPIEQIQEDYARSLHPAGTTNLYGIWLAEAPSVIEAYNNGVELDLKVSGGSNLIDVVYCTVDPTQVPTSISQFEQRRSRLQSLA
jgi:hypothetical protein